MVFPLLIVVVVSSSLLFLFSFVQTPESCGFPLVPEIPAVTKALFDDGCRFDPFLFPCRSCLLFWSKRTYAPPVLPRRRGSGGLDSFFVLALFFFPSLSSDSFFS